MRPIALFLLQTGRRIGFAWRRWLFSRAFPGVTFGPGVRIQPGVRIVVTDGGTLTVGARTLIGANTLIFVKQGHMEIGEDGYIGNGSVLACSQRISIGRDALIAEHVTIRDQDHGTAGDGPYRLQPPDCAPVRIGDNVWLGAKVTVVKGVSIGDSAVVGAGAVVTRDVAAGARVAGVPARPIPEAADQA